MKGVSVYAFRDGMQTLTDSMAQRLEEQHNVDLPHGYPVKTLTKVDNRFEVGVPCSARGDCCLFLLSS